MRTYTEADLPNAIAEVLDGGTVNGAARAHHIPPSTLRGRLLEGESHQTAHQHQQRLSVDQEQGLHDWILHQGKARIRPSTRTSTLARYGFAAPWWGPRQAREEVDDFLPPTSPQVRTKSDRRIHWERVNEASPANINLLFDLYDTVDYVPSRRYNADEGRIIEGQGVNGCVLGSGDVP